MTYSYRALSPDRQMRVWRRPRPWGSRISRRDALCSLALDYSRHRLTTSGYAYDSAGDVTGDGTNSWPWDAEERLTRS